MSAVTWLDYSEHERRKMLDVIDLFRERETRDELGLGAVRDGFADRFFPGTSTVMTRARYFLFVPWLHQRLEAKRVPAAQIADRARGSELELIGVINKSDDHEGNIGKLAGRTLKRLPSSVYWQGLGVWGIRLFPGAQSQYHSSLDGYYAALQGQRGRDSGRDGEHDDLVRPNWRAGLVAPPKEFPWACSLRLRRREAEYLCERIRTEPATSHSLLAEMVARRWRGKGVPLVWEHPQIAELPPAVRTELGQAQNFSVLTHGAALLYNLILAEQTRREESRAHFTDALRAWRTRCRRARLTFAAGTARPFGLSSCCKRRGSAPARGNSSTLGGTFVWGPAGAPRSQPGRAPADRGAGTAAEKEPGPHRPSAGGRALARRLRRCADGFPLAGGAADSWRPPGWTGGGGCLDPVNGPTSLSCCGHRLAFTSIRRWAPPLPWIC